MIDVSFFSFETIIILVILLILLILSFKFGKKLIITLILSIYPSSLIVANLSLLKFDLSKEVVFIVVSLAGYAITAFIIWNVVKSKEANNNIIRLIDNLVLSGAFLFYVLATIQYHNLTLSVDFFSFSGYTTNLFGTIPQDVALMIPIVAILVTLKKNFSSN